MSCLSLYPLTDNWKKLFHMLNICILNHKIVEYDMKWTRQGIVSTEKLVTLMVVHETQDSAMYD